MNRLNPELLKMAYSNGYFPMPDPNTGKILWFNPDPRAIFPLDGFHVSHSLARTLRGGGFDITLDKDFSGVMHGCADRADTWITDEFHEAYSKLHQLGLAHSVEVWKGSELAGGVYGVAIGGAFFAESKFYRVTDASKVALYHLVEHLKKRKFKLLEVQFLTPHLETLGAVEISGEDYAQRLKAALGCRVKWLP